MRDDDDNDEYDNLHFPPSATETADIDGLSYIDSRGTLCTVARVSFKRHVVHGLIYFSCRTVTGDVMERINA